jgi:hypothetical protein
LLDRRIHVAQGGLVLQGRGLSGGDTVGADDVQALAQQGAGHLHLAAGGDAEQVALGGVDVGEGLAQGEGGVRVLRLGAGQGFGVLPVAAPTPGS